MKRAKRAIPKIKEYVSISMQIECPHCHTYLRGGFNENTLRFKCSRCERPIEIDWEKKIKVNDFL